MNRRRRASHGALVRPVRVADEARAKVLSGCGKSAVLGPEYVYCFRPVGMIGHDANLYTRSEIPVPIPTAAEWDEQPEEFEILQHHIKALDQLLSNMADIDDMGYSLIGNLAMVCCRCNTDKGSLSLGQWLTRLSRVGEPRADHVETFMRARAVELDFAIRGDGDTQTEKSGPLSYVGLIAP